MSFKAKGSTAQDGKAIKAPIKQDARQARPKAFF
jgi:hypothetical protein